ncbi:MotA/TolQ/ExbB proton channel family protein [Nemorincola caseinilytica]|uniref:MotA/TolQ/ExbB proton channel family protein n=1 Tax=Nemorincola caseinilytica TaxID=2054315 RepID=A0ABP8NLA4_9BACT
MTLLSILLQVDTALNTAAAAAPPAPEKISLFNLLMEGGALMIPLLLCSGIMVYVFVERLMVIRKASAIDPTLMVRIQQAVATGDTSGALAACRNNATPAARVLEKGISRLGKPVDQIERSMENTGRLEVYKLEKNVSVLSTIAGIAPIFGFLGTIAGMIILFFNVQHQGFSLETIAGGIYTKMVTSAAGLIIGLLSYVGYAYLNAQINKAVHGIEATSVEFLDSIQQTNH